MKVDASTTGRRRLEHELKAPKRRTKRVAYSGLAFIADRVCLNKTEGQSVGAAIFGKFFKQ